MPGSVMGGYCQSSTHEVLRVQVGVRWEREVLRYEGGMVSVCVLGVAADTARPARRDDVLQFGEHVSI